MAHVAFSINVPKVLAVKNESTISDVAFLFVLFFSTPSLLPHFNCSRGSDMCIRTEEEMEERERGERNAYIPGPMNFHLLLGRNSPYIHNRSSRP